MSAGNNTTYMIQRDCLPVFKGKYWYKLTYKPIADSLNVRFDLSRGETELVGEDLPYNYDTIEKDCIKTTKEFTIYNIVSADTLPYEDNGIMYIPVTSQESQRFALSLIGTTFVKDKQIVKITTSNYLNYTENLVGNTFIDFSISNQIKQVLNSSNETSECEQVDISYFYEVLSED